MYQHESAEQALEITQRPAADAAELVLVGPIDFQTAQALATRIHEIRLSGHQNLALDLTGVTYLDSTGLAVLLSARRKFASADSTVVLRGISQQLRRILDVTGVARYFVLA